MKYKKALFSTIIGAFLAFSTVDLMAIDICKPRYIGHVVFLSNKIIVQMFEYDPSAPNGIGYKITPVKNTSDDGQNAYFETDMWEIFVDVSGDIGYDDQFGVILSPHNGDGEIRIDVVYDGSYDDYSIGVVGVGGRDRSMVPSLLQIGRRRFPLGIGPASVRFFDIFRGRVLGYYSLLPILSQLDEIAGCMLSTDKSIFITSSGWGEVEIGDVWFVIFKHTY